MESTDLKMFILPTQETRTSCSRACACVRAHTHAHAHRHVHSAHTPHSGPIEEEDHKEEFPRGCAGLGSS